MYADMEYVGNFFKRVEEEQRREKEQQERDDLYSKLKGRLGAEIMLAISKSTNARNAQDVKKYGGFFMPSPDPRLMNMASVRYIHFFIDAIANCLKQGQPLQIDYDNIMLISTNDLLNDSKIQFNRNERAKKMIAEGMANAAFYCKSFLERGNS